MIRHLKIERYRTHKLAELQDLGRINLLLGKNNAGKTVALEALFLLSFPVYPTIALKQLNERRGYDTTTDSEEIWNSLFYNWNESQAIHLELVEDIVSNAQRETRTRSLTIERKVSADFQRASSAVIQHSQFFGTTQGLHLDFTSSTGDAIQHTLIDMFDAWNSHEGSWELPIPPVAFIPAQRTILHQYDAQLFSRLRLAGRHQEIIEILNIIEPRLQTLEVIAPQGRSVVYGSLEGQQRPVPLSLMGNGMISMFAIVLAMLNNQGGLVLIDELENGLHYSVLVDLWCVIIETARRFDVQIFATTHSDECIRALVEALDVSGHTDDVRAYRFDRRDDTTHVVDYTAEILEAAIEVGLEVRG